MDAKLISKLEGERVIPLTTTRKDREILTVKDLTSLSADALKKNYPELIVKVSEKRLGMKLKNALAISNGTT